jgi:alanine racemase
VVSEAHARALSAAAAAAGVRLRVHAKVDTSMGRLGLAWEEAARLVPAIARLPGLALEGLFSHFAAGDDPDPRAVEGDEAVLLGAQGAEAVGADELAGWRGTISYEVLTSIRTDDRRPVSAPARTR